MSTLTPQDSKPSRAGHGPEDGFPLTSRAEALASQLSGAVKLGALRSECPEVLDLLASRWRDPHALARTFDDILFASERGAGGLRLSLDALLEVTSIKRHAAHRLPKEKSSVWEQAFPAMC